MKKIVITIFLALVMSTPAFAATYTVNSSGGDYSSVQACANAARAGDTCLVSAGTYSGSVSPSNDGSSGSWITFKAVAGQRPVVTGSFNLEGRDYIVIDGFEIRGGVSSDPYSGAACSNIKVLNNYINGAKLGVNLKGNDVLVSGNTFNNMRDDMVRQFGDRWTIRNNTVIGESDTNDEHMDFWQSWCNDGRSASYALLENNAYIDISGGNVHFTLVNGTSSCGDAVTNMIYRYNKVRNIGSSGIYIDNNSAASGSKDNTVYNNTFVDMSEGSFASWQDYVIVLNASSSSTGLNNLFYNAMDSSGAKGFLFASGGYQANNLYYDPDTTMTFSGAGSGESGAVKNQNPLMNNISGNDFSLRDGSPAVDRGRYLTKVASSDSGSGTTLIVEQAEFFQPGWGGAEADTIAVGSTTNAAKIASINYGSNTITLTSAISRSDGDPVYLYRDSDGTQVLNGYAPDIGAVESGLIGSPPPVDDDPPADDPPPVNPPEDPALAAPTGLIAYPVGINIVATADSTNDGNVPANTLDSNLTTRWSAYGDGEWLEFDLGSAHSISRAEIAFYRGTDRTCNFKIEVSLDKNSWTEVYNGTSSGTTALQEPYIFIGGSTSARYVRIVGSGNSSNNWNSITEVDIF